MVNYSDSLDRSFAALADPTRRAILARLALGETRVTDLAKPFDISLPAVSKHLKVLEDAGLLKRRREGRVHHCRLDPKPLSTAADWIAQHRAFWEKSLNRLAEYLSNELEEEATWQSRIRSPKRRSGSREPSGRAARKSSAPGRSRKR
ncbi:MAG TPA: metalloregulator ArsR/SmtB family transcription factor [Thermoanaerobaculia bacterium]|nr:metalloregulator ArsR/SmtB family transcription factor [Thermoanaerobaculia bacterium]